MNYKLDKVIATALNNDRLYDFGIFATSKSGADVYVVGDTRGSACYVGPLRYSYDQLSITLGHQFYKAVFPEVDSEVNPLDLSDRFKHISTIYLGAYYHEFFHVMYTDFNESYRRLNNLPGTVKGFAAKVSNILEDITIEGTGKRHYPYTEPYITELSQIFFKEDGIHRLEEAVKENPNNPGTLLQYLLLYVRGVKDLPEYELWEKNKDFIQHGAYLCINTISGKARIVRQVNYAIALAKLLEGKEPDEDLDKEPDASDVDMPMDSPDIDGLSSLGDISNRSVQNNPEETEEDIVDENGQPQQIKASRDPEAQGVEDDAPLNTDLTRENVSMLANDDPTVRTQHRADRLDKYYDTSKHLDSYNKTVAKNEEEIRRVVGTIRKMLATNNPSYEKYKMTGKFDVTTTYKKDNYKHFKRQTGVPIESDLVFEILVDNSGSMWGEKSRLAGEALIIFAEALDRLNIPFAVDAFTEDSTAVTIKLKEFTDLYSKTKTNLTLFTEQFNVRELGTFYSNVDEANLMYVRDILNRQPQKDKVLIVISDGATCGNWKDLKKVADDIEKDGTSVLGIGIYDDNVEDIYTNHTILKDRKDLEGLGTFLNRYLVRKIFR